MTLVIHDWGSGLGFHYASRNESKVKGIAFMEALLMPIPSWDEFPPDFRPVFEGFRTPDVGWDMIVNQNMFVEQILPGGMLRTLSAEEMDTYREPFKDPSSRKPVWRWPNELPIAGEPADVAQVITAYNQWLQQTELPKLLLHAAPGAIVTPPVVDWCRQSLKNLRIVDVGPGIHFLQEDNPHGIGAAIADWYKGF